MRTLWGVLVISIVWLSAGNAAAQAAPTERPAMREDVFVGWHSSELWRHMIPGASPRPGASLSGPFQIAGVIPFTVLDEADVGSEGAANLETTAGTPSTEGSVGTQTEGGDRIQGSEDL